MSDRLTDVLAQRLPDAIKRIKEMAADPALGNPSVYDLLGYVMAMAETIGQVGMERREALEKRVQDLEAAGIRYCGVYQRAVDYGRGDVVTEDGSAWIALHSMQGVRPGEADGWQLMVKRGRDGRDAK